MVSLSSEGAPDLLITRALQMPPFASDPRQRSSKTLGPCFQEGGQSSQV